ncbi:hypothetical protein BGZ99_005335 [Dissophora globulifera]|uniref:Membrane anchor Opy2 N-terminal domain-containing protein n=1 Tax=Dissophora globulifera TaxID=979702 RepID=A0A9P6RFE4_9FUNG|nr:hypothetical protein BGZ99_005335 [Dissophora globulifera]
MATPAPSPTCATSTCPARVCAPACKSGYQCQLPVIDSACQCPVASCARIVFDTGADNGNGDTNTATGKSSVVGPVVGAIAGLGVVALVAFFVIRRRQRQRRRQEALRMLGQDDSLDSFSKRWSSSNTDSIGKDVIRIAYIPSIIGDSPVATPESSVQHGGVLKHSFSALVEQERNKHDSVSSLDEAVVMAVTTKATPQVMKLNTIKATQSDLIQRSNTLHSSNSIKRSESRQRVANSNSRNATPSPLGPKNAYMDGTDSDSDESDIDGARTVVGETTGIGGRKLSTRSGRSYHDSGENNNNNPFMSESEKKTNATNASLHTNHTHDGATLKSFSRLSNPFLSAAESKAVSQSSNPSLMSLDESLMGTGTMVSDSSAVFTTIPLTSSTTPTAADGRQNYHGQDLSEYDPLADLMGGGVNLRPWANGGNQGSGSGSMTRDSTFSTMSDARSSTRGDGEEIMIFWDGNRNSKASNL